jgi:hypothetical protein
MNNMHGQPKSETTYKGDPDDITNAGISSSQEFTYFAPGEQVPVMNSLNYISWQNVGKEVDQTFESRGVEDISNNLALEFDLDVGLALIPLPFLSFSPSYTYTESKMYQHTNSKIINYPAIQKSVLSYADGIYHRTDNVAFSPYSGQPILTRTTDGYDKLDLQQSSNHSGKYYAYKFPATGQYKNIGQKSANETAVAVASSNVMIRKQYDGTNYSLFFSAAAGYSVCDAMNKFYPGDMIRITKKSSPTTSLGIFHVKDSVVGNNMYLSRTANFSSSNDNDTASTGGVIVEVLRSGRTNQLNTMIGGFTTYGDTANITHNFNSQQLADRETFADRLDSLLWAGSSGSINGTQVPPSLHFISPRTGDCISLRDSLVSAIIVSDPDSVFITFIVNGGLVGCHSSFHNPNKGHIGIDPETKQLAYFYPGNMCHPIDLCFEFCPYQISTTQVVVADAQTYDDHWEYNSNQFPVVTNSNKYENGSKGKWRQVTNNVYKDSIISANYSSQRNYKNAGVFKLQLFNWQNTSQNDTTHWIKLSTVTNYSPDGNAQEEKDVMGIYSAAKFGYKGTQPYLVAKNCEYQSVQFDGFEKIYTGNKFEDGWTPSSTFVRDSLTGGHSGKSCLKFTQGTSADSIDLKPLRITSQISTNGLSLKVWVKEDTSQNSITPIMGRIKQGATKINITFTKIARTGEWTLYEAQVSGSALSGFSTSSDITPWILSNYTGGRSLYIDDVRLQPLDAQVVCYVYDISTMRLIAMFDDQHFGMFYQYNGEGKLVRKMVETVQGTKTITETQYHTPQVQR